MTRSNFRVGLFGVGLFLLFGACDQESQKSEKASLDQEKESILSFLRTGTCSEDSECRFIGMGSKACGGPQEYIVYSASLDTAEVLRLISGYNTMEDAYNRKWGVASDCSVPPPPDSVRCLNGVCVGYWNGTPR